MRRLMRRAAMTVTPTSGRPPQLCRRLMDEASSQESRIADEEDSTTAAARSGTHSGCSMSVIAAFLRRDGWPPSRSP
jgi:hypothetical protein